MVNIEMQTLNYIVLYFRALVSNKLRNLLLHPTASIIIIRKH